MDKVFTRGKRQGGLGRVTAHQVNQEVSFIFIATDILFSSHAHERGISTVVPGGHSSGRLRSALLVVVFAISLALTLNRNPEPFLISHSIFSLSKTKKFPTPPPASPGVNPHQGGRAHLTLQAQEFIVPLAVFTPASAAAPHPGARLFSPPGPPPALLLFVTPLSLLNVSTL